MPEGNRVHFRLKHQEAISWAEGQSFPRKSLIRVGVSTEELQSRRERVQRKHLTNILQPRVLDHCPSSDWVSHKEIQHPKMKWYPSYFSFMATPCGMPDLPSLIRDWTHIPVQWKHGVLTGWATREAPVSLFSLTLLSSLSQTASHPGPVAPSHELLRDTLDSHFLCHLTTCYFYPRLLFIFCNPSPLYPSLQICIFPSGSSSTQHFHPLQFTLCTASRQPLSSSIAGCIYSGKLCAYCL